MTTNTSIEKNFAIDVIVIGLNESKNITRCIESIIKVPLINQIIFVDSGSTDCSIRLAAKYPIQVFRSTETASPSKSRNYGASKAESDYVLFLDADMEFIGDLERLISIMERHKAVGIVGIRNDLIKPKNQNLPLEINKNVYGFTSIKDASHIGGSLLIKTKDFSSSFKYSEDLHAFEETFLNLSIKHIGGKIISAPEPFINHYLEEEELSLLKQFSKKTKRTLQLGKLIVICYKKGLWNEFYSVKKDYVKYNLKLSVSIFLTLLSPYFLLLVTIIFLRSPSLFIKNLISLLGVTYYFFNYRTSNPTEFTEVP